VNVARWIERKRDGGELAGDEIADLIAGYVRGDVPDYQMAAFAMAVTLRGMSRDETLALTEAMLASGETLHRPQGGPPRVGKHSTGGVGDKVSLVLVPLLAACGLAVPKISGRGLGPTGGTLDKLESIPGLRIDLSPPEAAAVLAAVGCHITSASADIVPADRKLYALRDVTGTVVSIPLITASILSKKLAEDLDALVLDVKSGSGAFMQTLEEARELAWSLVTVASRHGIACTALLTDMDQPLGRAAGNAIEVDEAVAVLRGEGPAELVEITAALGAELLLAVGRAPSREAAAAELRRRLGAGEGYEVFARMVRAQGGDLEAPRPRAPAHDLPAPGAGWVESLDTRAVGRAVIELGGGRRRQGDVIDPSVGVECLVRIGDRLETGDPLFRVYGRDAATVERVRRGLLRALELSLEPVDPRPLVLERIARPAEEAP
jgi:pyrimidine-nucleoside phosphorylase